MSEFKECCNHENGVCRLFSDLSNKINLCEYNGSIKACNDSYKKVINCPKGEVNG